MNKIKLLLVVDAMMKALEEKLEQEVSIPRKLHDEWEPTIKVKIKNYECFALCDLGASVSTIPKSLCDVLGLTDIEECSLNLPLADSTNKNPLGRINDILILANWNQKYQFLDNCMMNGNLLSKSRLKIMSVLLYVTWVLVFPQS